MTKGIHFTKKKAVLLFAFVALVALLFSQRILYEIALFQERSEFRKVILEHESVKSVKFRYWYEGPEFYPYDYDLYDLEIMMRDKGEINIRSPRLAHLYPDQIDYSDYFLVSRIGKYLLHRSCTGEKVAHIEFVDILDESFQERLGIEIDSLPDLIEKYPQIEDELATWHLPAEIESAIPDYENVDCLYTTKSETYSI